MLVIFLIHVLLLLLVYNSISLEINLVKMQSSIKDDSKFIKDLDYYTYGLSLGVGSPKQNIMSIISLTLPFSFLASSFESPLSTTGISSKNKLMCAYNNQLYIGIEYSDFIEEFNKEKITFALIIKGEEGIDNGEANNVFSFPYKTDIINQDIIEDLYKKEVIVNKKFALTFHQNHPRFILGYNEKKHYDKCNMKLIDFDQHKWKCKISYLLMGNQQMYLFNEFYFDTLSHFITIPSIQASVIFSHIVSKSKDKCYIHIDKVDLILVCHHDADISTLPNIVIYRDSDKLILKWKDLMDYNKNENVFVSKLVANRIGLVSWIVGTPILNGNMLIFDKEENSIGFINIDKEYPIINIIIMAVIFNNIIGIFLCKITSKHF